MTALLFHGARKLDAHGPVDDFWMRSENDTIVSTGSGGPPRSAAVGVDHAIDLADGWLVPGFLDLHGHGGGGHSFDASASDVIAALATHRRHGTTRSVISLVANPIDTLARSLAIIAELAAIDPLVLGSHLEGPFLSPEARGAHDAASLSTPNPDLLDRLLQSANGTLKQVTIAPELPGALDAIGVLTAAGARVAVGHTVADAALAHEAFDRGATLLTHAFNAMPGIHHRRPGPVIAAFDDRRVTLELILDGIHVDPSVARLAFGSAPGRIALITDAMAAADFDDGDYRLGTREVTVRDGRATLTGTETIAGSTLTQDVALSNAIVDVGLSPLEAVAALTLTPARALGIEQRHGLLEPGFAADAVALDDDWRVTAVWANGRPISRQP